MLRGCSTHFRPSPDSRILAKADWTVTTDEGIVGYVYPNVTCGRVALFREYSGSQMDHFYKASVQERDTASCIYDYVQEETAGYLLPF